MSEFEYDITNPKSIESYAKELVGKTFFDIYNADQTHGDDYGDSHENKLRKGGLGELIEECYFHYEANSESRADFEEAGVELKVTPYKMTKAGEKVAKERLVLSMIDYMNVVNETFEDSHMWNKSKLILLIYYLYQQEIANRLDYRIDYVTLFSPPAEDIEIIKNDFETIVNKIREGKAHELSESDTLYLGACTKAAKATDLRKQPYSDEMAKPRAFAFKNSYMTYVLNNYVIRSSSTYESIVTGKIDMPFEKYIVQKISKFEGYTQRQLCDEFNINLTKGTPKNLGAILAYKILGIKGNNAEEFVKANIVVKTIRIGKNNKIRENMSFPTFKFKELVEEEWEDSQIYNYLSETRFLFVVYKFNENDELVLKGCQFWNIPYFDLEGQVQLVWNKTKNVIKNGIKITQVGEKRISNLPHQSDNPVCHVRPHAQNVNDTYELPDGSKYPKQCFWLNNSYIESQLDKSFFE